MTVTLVSSVQSSRCANQIEEVCRDVEKTINQTVQNTLNSLERDCDQISQIVDEKLREDRYDQHFPPGVGVVA